MKNRVKFFVFLLTLINALYSPFPGEKKKETWKNYRRIKPREQFLYIYTPELEQRGIHFPLYLLGPLISVTFSPQYRQRGLENQIGFDEWPRSMQGKGSPGRGEGLISG